MVRAVGCIRAVDGLNHDLDALVGIGVDILKSEIAVGGLVEQCFTPAAIHLAARKGENLEAMQLSSDVLRGLLLF